MKFMTLIQSIFLVCLLTICKSSSDTKFQVQTSKLSFSMMAQTSSQNQAAKPLKELMTDLKTNFNVKGSNERKDQKTSTKNYIEPSSSFLEKKKPVKKGKKCTKPKKMKVVYKKNKLLSGSKKHIKETPCVIKKGILYLSSGKKSKNTLKTKQIFIKLTPNKITFHKSFKTTTHISSLPLNSILRITQTYAKTFCFDIVLTNSPLKTSTLCAKNQKVMNEWIHAILAFKHCINYVTREVVKNRDTLLKFANISGLSSHHDGNDLHSLYYDNRDTAFKKNLHTITRDSNIKKHISNIAKTINLSHLAHSQLRRRYAGKINEAKRFTDKVIQKQAMIKKIIEKKALEEKEKENNLISLEHRHREIKLLREVEAKIRKMKIDELNNYKSQYESQIKLEKSRANSEASNIFKMILDQKKLTKYNVCYSNDLHNFNDKKHVKGLCKKYYGLSGMRRCRDKNNFCEMCCEFHIGISYAAKRLKCKRKCEKRVKGKVPEKKRREISSKINKIVSKLKIKSGEKNKIKQQLGKLVKKD